MEPTPPFAVGKPVRVHDDMDAEYNREGVVTFHCPETATCLVLLKDDVKPRKFDCSQLTLIE